MKQSTKLAIAHSIPKIIFGGAVLFVLSFFAAVAYAAYGVIGIILFPVVIAGIVLAISSFTWALNNIEFTIWSCS